MKATFNHIEFLKANREVAISKYNSLTAERFYNGCTLESFMNQVISYAKWWRSEKEAVRNLSFVLGNVYVDNSKVFATDKATSALRNKYAGTSAMALV